MSTQNPLDTSMFLRPTIPKALQQWERGKSSRWKMSLEAVVSIAHVGGLGLWSPGCQPGDDGTRQRD